MKKYCTACFKQKELKSFGFQNKSKVIMKKICKECETKTVKKNYGKKKKFKQGKRNILQTRQ